MVKLQYSVVYKRRVAITEEGSYILSGTLTDGQILVAAIDDNNIDGAIYSKSEWFGEIIVCTTIKSCYSVIYF